MRRSRSSLLVALLIALLLSAAGCQGGAGADWRSPDPAVAGGFWAQTVRPDMLQDLTRLAQAPRIHMEAEYAPETQTLSGKQVILHTNQTGRPLERLYLRTIARAWGPGEAEGDLQLTNLRVNG